MYPEWVDQHRLDCPVLITYTVVWLKHHICFQNLNVPSSGFKKNKTNFAHRRRKPDGVARLRLIPVSDSCGLPEHAWPRANDIGEAAAPGASYFRSNTECVLRLFDCVLQSWHSLSVNSEAGNRHKAWAKVQISDALNQDRRSSKLKHRVCVTRLLLPWLRPVYPRYTWGIQAVLT